MSESNARELSQPAESGSSLFVNFNAFTKPADEDRSHRDRAREDSAIGGASSFLFPKADELLKGLQELHEERHNSETIPLGTVPYPNSKLNKGM